MHFQYQTSFLSLLVCSILLKLSVGRIRHCDLLLPTPEKFTKFFFKHLHHFKSLQRDDTKYTQSRATNGQPKKEILWSI